MRRRWVWAIFLPCAFVLGAGSIMMLGGLMQAFSFGTIPPAEIEHDLAVFVTWPAFGLAALAYLAGRWRRRSREFPHREAFGELAVLAFAIFFGGLLALARASGLVWDRPFVAALFLAYAIVESRTPRTAAKRRVLRAVSLLAVGLATSWIIRYAAS